ncbi:MAG: hypothetical protein LBC80_01140 [Treponema sp.]|jgi:uncharacterized protein (TIGR02145 family)|nr:hypothetical protein [Treponema sp.]
MKKIHFIFVVLIFVFSNCTSTTPSTQHVAEENEALSKGLSASPGLRGLFQSGENYTLIEEGVVINGVEWAAHNVGRAGVFVEKPEDSGWTYQWNSIRPEFSMEQATAGLLPASFLTNYPAGSFWEKSRDPSPQGWRVPTQDEVLSLFDTFNVSNEWETKNGVAGRRFTDRFSGKSIFIPAAGKWFADIDAGERTMRKLDIGTGGYYWTATGQGDFGALTFEFNSSGVLLETNHRTMAFMIRPVADR